MVTCFNSCSSSSSSLSAMSTVISMPSISSIDDPLLAVSFQGTIEHRVYSFGNFCLLRLSLARSGSSIDEIDGIEITVDIADSDEDDEEHELKQVTITGFQDFQSLYTCIQCKRAMDVDDQTLCLCSRQFAQLNTYQAHHHYQ